MAEKYNASNIAIEQILNFIKSGEIAIPEIQRPFVWKPKPEPTLPRATPVSNTEECVGTISAA